MTFTPYEEGGIAGPRQKALVEALQGVQAPPLQVDGPATLPASPDAPQPPTPSLGTPQLGLGQNKLTGFDMNKFSDPNKSEKYKIGEVFSRYDPRGGITQQLLNELNGLGIAEFSGQGDQLSVKNTKNDPRFGRGGTADVIKGLKGNNEDTAWQPWFVDDQPQQAPSDGSRMPMFGGSTINNMLQSDAQSNIQQALGSIQQPGLLQQLIAALGGGQ
jgi:hypothetical protein